MKGRKELAVRGITCSKIVMERTNYERTKYRRASKDEPTLQLSLGVCAWQVALIQL